MTIDWQIVILALIAATPPTIIAWRTGKRVDGRMEEMLELARKNAAGDATIAEKEAEGERKIEARRVAEEANDRRAAHAIDQRDPIPVKIVSPAVVKVEQVNKDTAALERPKT